MRHHILRYTFVPLVLLLGLLAGSVTAHSAEPGASAASGAPLGTGFTYQGQLKRASQPVNEDCLFAFRLYDDPDSGSQVGSAITTTVPITVSDGLFTLVLNEGGEFGPTAFDGGARWLDVRVKCPADPAYLGLGRQALTAAPYALYAPSAGYAASAGNADTVDGLQGANLARITRYGIPGFGGTVTMTIPHYNSFQIVIGEAYASPQRIAWLSVIENDYDIAWTGIDPDGNVVTGTAGLDSTDTIMTVGPNITLRCPGRQAYELVLVSTWDDVRAFVTW